MALPKLEEIRGASVNGIEATKTDRTYLERFDVKEARGIDMNIWRQAIIRGESWETYRSPEMGTGHPKAPYAISTSSGSESLGFLLNNAH